MADEIPIKQFKDLKFRDEVYIVNPSFHTIETSPILGIKLNTSGNLDLYIGTNGYIYASVDITTSSHEEKVYTTMEEARERLKELLFKAINKSVENISYENKKITEYKDKLLKLNS